MPYVITTKTPAVTVSDEACMRVLSRHAVATLEEARAAILADLGDMNAIGGPEDELVGNVLDISESGGTVGPLPDGTVIEVEQIGWATLWQDVRPDPPTDSPLWSEERIIDAYNARQDR